MFCVVLWQNMVPLDMAPSLALSDILGEILEKVLYILLRFIFGNRID